jgi:hypothetical protein
VEEPPEEEGDAAPVTVEDEATGAVSVGSVVGTPVVGIEKVPVAPGRFAAGRGDYKRNQRRQSPCTLSLPCVCV